MVFVDHVGKLFERINANEPAACDKRSRHNAPRQASVTASFCPRHGNHRVRELSASQGWVLLLLFLPTKKSKNDKGIAGDIG
jgi:hypothetical protein